MNKAPLRHIFLRTTLVILPLLSHFMLSAQAGVPCHFDKDQSERIPTISPLIWEVENNFSSDVDVLKKSFSKFKATRAFLNELNSTGKGHLTIDLAEFINLLKNGLDRNALCDKETGIFYSPLELKNRYQSGQLFSDLILSFRFQETGKELNRLDGQDVCTEAASKEVSEKAETRKPKVVILSSEGGGGHTSAAKALIAFLGDKYETKIITPADKYLNIKFFDDFFAEEKWFQLKNLVKLQFLAEEQLKFHFQEIRRSIISEKPDIIVSVFPLGNRFYKAIAEHHHIPMLVTPPEYNPKSYLRKMSDVANYASFQGMFRYGDPKIRGILKKKNITAYQFSGSPIRKEMAEFADKYRNKDPQILEEISALKRQYGMGDKDKMVVISLGAKSFGSAVITQYLNAAVKNQSRLTRNGNKIHFVVAAGSNKEFLEELNGLSEKMKGKNLNIVLHPEGWMDAKGMAIRLAGADTSIIKPGGSTTAEFLALGKRALFKSDSGKALPWENDNMNFFIKNNWGSKLAYTGHGKINTRDYIQKLVQNLYELSSDVNTPVNNFGPVFSARVEKLLSFREKYYK